MEKKTSPNIIDVARKAGVSPATVSRVVSRKEMVKSSTVERVMAAMQELNYEPENYISRKLRKALTIAVIIPEMTDQFFTMLVKGIETEARLHGYSLLLYSTDNSPVIENEVIRLSLEKNIDGAIIVSSDVDETIFQPYRQNKIHHIFLDRIIAEEDISCVISDDEEGSYQATKYLIDLGHREILYIGGDKKFSTEKNRLKGFKRALSEHKIELREELIRECSFHYEEAFQETNAVLSREYKFSAIFAANDLIAFGAKAAVEKSGKIIPDDISLIGYGDSPAAAYLSLTTVSSPSYEMGRSSFLLLLDYIENRLEREKKIILRPSIVFRSSCRRNSNLNS